MRPVEGGHHAAQFEAHARTIALDSARAERNEQRSIFRQSSACGVGVAKMAARTLLCVLFMLLRDIF